MNGNVIERQEFRDTYSLEAIYRYEYHINGKVKLLTKWVQARDRETGYEIEFMTEKEIYNENGHILLIERYNILYQEKNGLYETITYVYLENGKLDYVKTTNLSDTYSIAYYRYDEDGQLKRIETFVDNKMTEYIAFSYYENGVLKEELLYSVSFGSQESLKIYDEFGRLSKEIVSSTVTTYLYDQNGRLAEKCEDNPGNRSVLVTKYEEYHENGEVAKIQRYFRSREDGTENNFGSPEYYDEYGYRIIR